MKFISISLALLALPVPSVAVFTTHSHSKVLNALELVSTPYATATSAACKKYGETQKYLEGKAYSENVLCQEMGALSKGSLCWAALKAAKPQGGFLSSGAGKSLLFSLKAKCRELSKRTPLTCDDFSEIDGCPDKMTAFKLWPLECGAGCSISTCCKWKEDECAENKDNCHQQASCNDTDASFTCSCNEGYTGNGVNCQDSNECSRRLDHNCNAHANCTNTIGSFTCKCSVGYSGNGVVCADIDECKIMQRCSSNGKCSNTDGSFTCSCKEGYEGDGIACKPKGCDASIAPAHGQAGQCGPDLAHGATCAPMCDPGYTLSGLTKCHLGKVQHAECNPSACDISPPENGLMGHCGSTLAHGQTCAPFCHDGYDLEELKPFSCNFGTLTSAVCAPKSCTGADAPKNGQTGSCAGLLRHGETCQPSCNAGYDISGPTSCNLGKLDSAYCIQRPCEVLGAPPHATMGNCPQKLAHGATCQPQCEPGYALTKPASCKIGSLVPAQCNPSPCKGIVAPSNGKIGECTAGFLEHGTDCEVHCNPGYSANKPMSCSFGTLTKAHCLPNPCEAPAVPQNGALGMCTTKLEDGEICRPSCNVGYELQGAFSCNKGSMSPALCNAKSCDPSAPPANGRAGTCTNSLNSGATCQPTCDRGFVVSGATSCSLGKLTSANCTPMPCDASTPPEHGKVGSCHADLVDGQTCQPECDHGYDLERPASCSRGTLSQAICKARTCDTSKPPAHGSVGNCEKTLLSGESCQPECEAGYEVSGPSRCELGSLTAATCNVKNCNANSPPANGQVGTCTSELASGMTCQNLCDEGYEVSGKTSCNLGSLVPATCKAKSCGGIKAPQNGNLGECTGNLEHGQSCKPTCGDRFLLEGNTSCHLGQVTEAVCKSKWWYVATSSESCDQSCDGLGYACDADAMDLLSGGTKSQIEAAYAKAGVTCQNYDSPCTAEKKCAEWGAPYVRASNFNRGEGTAFPCFGGDAAGSCSARPSDPQLRRLCACKVKPPPAQTTQAPTSAP
eukprot:TRINITY_DN943_c0_g1_i2.p1 TRINITY_DN943_c0_g1~~TRINITY_DN943_c0_g1_i2.p1  ORF type:complete len:1016 (+),score=179.38 TRINITY_DN943_c0_g1_i2:96-3143(+)